MSIGSAWDLSSDAELITAVRSGEAAAFGVLYERHAGAARTVARQYTNSAADADDAVAEAFSRVFSAVQGGGGPDVAFRAYLFTVLRRVALERVEAGRRAQPTDDIGTFETFLGAAESTEEPTMAGFERGIVSQAYSSLPERWQAVLWYTEVEGLSAQEIAPVLGLTANGVAALAYRAREGLRQAYLQQHLAAPSSEACTLVNSKLGAYVRGGLAKRETALVESHLDECGACRALVLELGDVNHGMRVVIAPLVLGAAVVGLLQGIGFGGAIAAAGHAAGGTTAGAGAGAGAGAAGSGAGSASGSGAGTGAGSAAGAGAGSAATAGAVGGSGVLAGVGAASGVAAAAAGAAVLVGSAPAAPAAAASGGAGAGTGTGTAFGPTGSGLATVGAPAGAAGAAGGATAGGLLALVASAPLAVIGAAAAVTVAAVAVGVAGVLGAFTTQDPDQAPPVAVEETAAPQSGEESDPVDPDDPAGPTDPADPTEPGALPDASDGSTGGGAGPSGIADGPTTPVDSTPPGVPVTDPANLVLDPLTPVTFVAGVREQVDVTVANSGGAAAQVATLFTFDPGVDWDVQAIADAPGGGGGAAVPTASPTAWTCARVSATTAQCTLPGLAARSRSTLHASVLVDDVVLDGERDLGVRISTWAPGQAAATGASLTARLSSRPAMVATGPLTPLVLQAVAASPTSVALTVPVSNTGGTTQRDVHVLVDLPADLPDGVVLTPQDGGGWTCASAAPATLDCVLAALPPRSDRPLALDVTAPALDLAYGVRFVDVDVTTSLGVRVPAATASASVALSVRSAAGALSAELPAGTTLQRREPRVVTLDVTNPGGTSVTGLEAQIDLPAGVFHVELGLPTAWTCTAPPGSNVLVTCTLAEPLAPGASAPLLLAIQTNGETDDVVTATVRSGGLSAEATTTLDVIASELAFSRAVTADLVQDATGTLSFAVSNGGTAVARDVVARVTVPPTVAFDALDRAGQALGWTCERATDQVAVCRLATLDPGASASLVLPATASAATDRRVVVEVTSAQDAAVLTSTATLRVASAGLSPRGSWTADATQGYRAAEIGAPLLGCDQTTADCRTAMASLGGTSSNNGFAMVPLTDATGAPRASAATLELPAGAEVTFAGLYWSANRYAGGPVADTWTGASQDLAVGSPTSVSLTAPGAPAVPVDGAVIALVRDNGSREYYQAFADVTAQVSAGGAGAWSVDGATTSATRLNADRTYYAGWSLVVVYALPGLAQDVTVYDGGAWIASNASTTFAFEAPASSQARIGVVAWEGDRNGASGGDRLTLNGAALTPVRWDGADGLVQDAFTSTAVGSAYANALGIDAKAFRPAALADGLNRLTASTTGDQYLIGAVTVTTAPR